MPVEQEPFHMFNGQALQKIFRCNAGPSREEPMKMEWAQLSRGRELVEIGLVRVMSIQKSDHICDSFVIIHTGTLSSLETPAHPLLAAIFESFRGKGFGQLVRMTSLSCCTSASLAAPSSRSPQTTISTICAPTSCRPWFAEATFL